MGRLIRHLYETRDLLLYQDFRTGSIQDLSPYLKSVSTIGNLAWGQNRNGVGCQGDPAGRFEASDPSSLAVPSTHGGLVAGGLIYNTANWPGYVYTLRTDTYRVFLGSTVFSVYDSTTASYSSGPAVSEVKSFIVRMQNGYAVTFYLDGVPTVGLGVIAPSTPTSYIWTCLSSVSILPTPIHGVFAADGANLSDTDIARLHRELIEGPTVVRRPSKYFSLPYPTKTPAQAAAEGLIIDLDCSRLEGRTILDMSGSSYNAEANDHVTNQKDGPFVGSVGLYNQWAECPVASATKTFEDSYTISIWFKPKSLVGATRVLLGSNSVPYVGKTGSNEQLLSYRDSGGSQRTYNTTRTFYDEKWTMVHYVLDYSNPDVTVSMYCDGIQTLAPATLSQGLGSIGNRTLVNVFDNAGTIPGFNADYALVRYRDGVAFTAEQARAEYLEGARKCLLDARVHRDGSCPVSLEDVTVSNELANGWKVQSGTWRVVEDAPSGGRPGDRWMSGVGGTTRVVYRNSLSAYGSWHMSWKPDGSNTYMAFISSTQQVIGMNGYYLRDLGSVLRLYEVNAGVPSLISTINHTLSGSTQVWVTRRFDGLFSVWLKGGGVYSDWTLVLTGTSLVHTLSTYVWLEGVSSTGIGGVVSYVGEMTPEEAVSKGCLPNNRTET